MKYDRVVQLICRIPDDNKPLNFDRINHGNQFTIVDKKTNNNKNLKYEIKDWLCIINN